MEETTVKVKLWGMVLLVVAALGFLYISSTAMESRITRNETSITYIVSSMTEVKDLVKEIRQDQVRRYKREDGR